MTNRFPGFALYLACAFGLACSAASATPLKPSRPEILKVDLADRIKAEDLSLVVIMPKSCEGRDLAALCARFRTHTPDPGSYVYRADSRIAQRRSIEGQVQALPAALKERRYVMLLDWEFALAKSSISTTARLNGEALVYDLAGKKVVWHAIVLEDADLAKFNSLAKSYIRTALNHMGNHVRLQGELAALGMQVRDLGAGAAGGDANLVIFNRRPDFLGGQLSSFSELVTITPVPVDIAKTRYFSMPVDTYLALNLPAGKYRITHLGKTPVEIDAGARQLAYRLGEGGAIGEVAPGEFERERLATRNLLLPDAPEGLRRRVGVLSWSEVPVEPGTPVSEDLPPELPLPATARPVRADRPFARVRMIGLTGLTSEVIPDSTCYRTRTALQNAGSVLGDAARSMVKPRGMFGLPGLNALGLPGAIIASQREDKSVRIGMKDTPASRSLDKKGNVILPAYVHESEVAAGRPVTVTAAYMFTSGNRTATCRIAGSFVPEAGADYEASFELAGERCYARVNEIDAVNGGDTMLGVELEPAAECR